MIQIDTVVNGFVVTDFDGRRHVYEERADCPENVAEAYALASLLDEHFGEYRRNKFHGGLVVHVAPTSTEDTCIHPPLDEWEFCPTMDLRICPFCFAAKSNLEILKKEQPA